MPRSAARSRSVLTLGGPPDGRGAVLSSAERPPSFGAIDPAQTRALRDEQATSLGPSGVLVPGEDAAMGASERRIGRSLAALLDGPQMRPVASRLDALAAAARTAGQPFDLLLDLRDPELWALPWELIELLPQGEALGGCRIARLVEGHHLPTEPEPGLDVLIWSPTPQDPTCARVLEALEATLAGLPGLQRAVPGQTPTRSRVVHVVCHGGDRGEPVLELGPERSLDAATLARVLEPVIRDAMLVVLDVCGSSAGVEPEALPAWRVVNAGAAACLAPRAALDVDASIAMSQALYGVLAAGEPLSDAVQASRRAIAALGLPDPSARWWTLALVTADAAVLDRAPVQARDSRIAGAERAAPDAAAVLSRAIELAEAQGFLGLEHLALAMSRLADPPPLLAMAQPSLASFAARAAAFQPTGIGVVQPSPRLRALLAALPDGYDLVALLRAMAVSRPIRLDAPSLSLLVRELGPLSHTLSGEAPAQLDAAGWRSPVAQPRLCLEVLAGPDDGLICELGPELPLLGRWDPLCDRPEVAVLFRAAGATDLAVSRRHLRWPGGDTIEALAPTGLRRGGELQSLSPTIRLRPGDLLELGHGTRLEVVRVPG